PNKQRERVRAQGSRCGEVEEQAAGACPEQSGALAAGPCDHGDDDQDQVRKRAMHANRGGPGHLHRRGEKHQQGGGDPGHEPAKSVITSTTVSVPASLTHVSVAWSTVDASW